MRLSDAGELSAKLCQRGVPNRLHVRVKLCLHIERASVDHDCRKLDDLIGTEAADVAACGFEIQYKQIQEGLFRML